jgi:kinesin family protein 4/21/27
MKQQRVKLFKQLKEDNANFQKWKQAKDREVMQLKAKVNNQLFSGLFSTVDF